jgi:hypothetical protein
MTAGWTVLHTVYNRERRPMRCTTLTTNESAARRARASNVDLTKKYKEHLATACLSAPFSPTCRWLSDDNACPASSNSIEVTSSQGKITGLAARWPWSIVSIFSEGMLHPRWAFITLVLFFVCLQCRKGPTACSLSCSECKGQINRSS